MTMTRPHRALPTRSCIACRTKQQQPRMLRYALQGRELVPRVGVRALPGRSAYLCPRRACLERALKRRAFGRAFAGRSRPVALDPVEAEELWARTIDSIQDELRLLEHSTRDPGTHSRHIELQRLLSDLSSQLPSRAASDSRRASDSEGGSPSHG